VYTPPDAPVTDSSKGLGIIRSLWWIWAHSSNEPCNSRFCGTRNYNLQTFILYLVWSYKTRNFKNKSYYEEKIAANKTKVRLNKLYIERQVTQPQNFKMQDSLRPSVVEVLKIKGRFNKGLQNIWAKNLSGSKKPGESQNKTAGKNCCIEATYRTNQSNTATKWSCARKIWKADKTHIGVRFAFRNLTSEDWWLVLTESKCQPCIQEWLANNSTCPNGRQIFHWVLMSLNYFWL